MRADASIIDKYQRSWRWHWLALFYWGIVHLGFHTFILDFTIFVHSFYHATELGNLWSAQNGLKGCKIFTFTSQYHDWDWQWIGKCVLFAQGKACLECRLNPSGRAQLNAIRSPGMYIVDVSHFKTDSKYATWSTSIQAKGDLETWLVPFIAIKDMLSKHASVAEAACRTSKLCQYQLPKNSSKAPRIFSCCLAGLEHWH